jgi:hypothetical protein
MLKDRETRDCEVAPTGALRRFPPGVLPTRVLSRLIRLWWRPVELPHSARPITISIANFASLQAGGKSRPIASAISLQLQQNCSRIAPELHQNCTRIAAKTQQLHTIAAKPYRGGGGRPETRGNSARRNCNLPQFIPASHASHPSFLVAAAATARAQSRLIKAGQTPPSNAKKQRKALIIKHLKFKFGPRSKLGPIAPEQTKCFDESARRFTFIPKLYGQTNC